MYNIFLVGEVVLKFKILIINLDSSFKRLTSIKNQCEQLGIGFERVRAVQGNKIPPEEKSRIYNVETNKQKYYKLLTDGEIGCYFSHTLCWQKILDDDLDFALVLEDDAILHSTLPKYISEIAKLNTNWDYIKLSHGRKKKHIEKTIALTGDLLLGTCAKLPSTCSGQFISKSGAKKLLSTAFPISRPVDSDIQYWFEKNLKCLVVRPFPVSNGDFGSDINKLGCRRQTKARQIYRIWSKIKFELSLILNKRHQGKLPSFR